MSKKLITSFFNLAETVINSEFVGEIFSEDTPQTDFTINVPGHSGKDFSTTLHQNTLTIFKNGEEFHKIKVPPGTAPSDISICVSHGLLKMKVSQNHDPETETPINIKDNE